MCGTNGEGAVHFLNKFQSEEHGLLTTNSVVLGEQTAQCLHESPVIASPNVEAMLEGVNSMNEPGIQNFFFPNKKHVLTSVIA